MTGWLSGLKGRLLCLILYGAAAVLALHAQSVVEATYNAVCPPDHRAITSTSPADDFQIIAKAFLLAIVPIAIVRRRTALGAVLAIAVLIFVAAIGVSFTAHNRPYECFTNGGDYEDHVSGTTEFMFLFILLTAISYAVSVVDLSIWLYRTASSFVTRPPRQG